MEMVLYFFPFFLGEVKSALEEYRNSFDGDFN
jgi:hypothetical protein